jgi:hypothetical protein
MNPTAPTPAAPNFTALILTSVVVAAVVSAVITSMFALMGQFLERRARRKELIFAKSMELAKANREFIAVVAEKTGQMATLHDYAVYAEMYYWLIAELHDNGRLPVNWRKEIAQKFPDIG